MSGSGGLAVNINSKPYKNNVYPNIFISTKLHQLSLSKLSVFDKIKYFLYNIYNYGCFQAITFRFFQHENNWLTKFISSRCPVIVPCKFVPLFSHILTKKHFWQASPVHNLPIRLAPKFIWGIKYHAPFWLVRFSTLSYPFYRQKSFWIQ